MWILTMFMFICLETKPNTLNQEHLLSSFCKINELHVFLNTQWKLLSEADRNTEKAVPKPPACLRNSLDGSDTHLLGVLDLRIIHQKILDAGFIRELLNSVSRNRPKNRLFKCFLDLHIPVLLRTTNLTKNSRRKWFHWLKFSFFHELSKSVTPLSYLSERDHVKNWRRLWNLLHILLSW